MEHWDNPSKTLLSSLEDTWRQRVDTAARQYHSAKKHKNDNAEGALAEYARVLRIYADLVLRSKLPPAE